ncbi:MAG: hypothetical protein ABI478_03310 [Propionivibrio sp.]
MPDHQALIGTGWQEQKAQTAAACAALQASAEWWSALTILCCRTLELQSHLFFACRPDRAAGQENGRIFVTRRS